MYWRLHDSALQFMALTCSDISQLIISICIQSAVREMFNKSGHIFFNNRSDLDLEAVG